MEIVPHVSLGLPVFNGENYLEETLDSILSQSFQDFELLISDNASTDRTAEICQEYCERDDRIRYIRQERNIGASKNYDTVFHATCGTYFKWCAHDDLLGEHFLESCIAELEANPDAVGAIPAEIQDIDATGETISIVHNDMDPDNAGPAGRFLHYVMQGYIAPHCSPIFSLFRRRALTGSQLHGDYWGSDRVLVCEMLLRGRIVSVDGSCFAHRRHAEQFSSNLQHGNAYWANWINPESKKTLHLRDIPYTLALAKVTMRAPIGAKEKAEAMKAVLAFARQRRQGLIAEARWRLSVSAKSTLVGRFMWQTAKRVLSSS